MHYVSHILSLNHILSLTIKTVRKATKNSSKPALRPREKGKCCEIAVSLIWPEKNLRQKQKT